MEKVIANNLVYFIEYKETTIGDFVFDKSTNSVYEATIMDADDFNWVIIKTENVRG